MEETVRLSAPLPGNALEAELTWLAPRPGLRPGDVAVARAEARRAELRVKALDEHWETRRLSLAEADAWLADARALQADMATFDARTRTRTAERGQERDALGAAIVPRCGYCDEPRAYAGLRHVVTAGAPDQLTRVGSGLDHAGWVAWHAYACPRCGSVELFAAGALEHPLPGAAGSRT